MRNTPVELQEIHYPFLIERFALRADSGGAGQHRGGMGVELCYRALGACSVNINLERIIEPPWGLEGGGPGRSNAALIRRSDGTERRVTKESNIAIAPGDTVTFWTAGGGGYGAPAKRDPQEIERDLKLGYISAAGAAQDYGWAAEHHEKVTP